MEGEIYLDSITCDDDHWTHCVTWARNHPHRVKAANELPESDRPRPCSKIAKAAWEQFGRDRLRGIHQAQDTGEVLLRHHLDSWTLCAQLANYWREWFNVPTEGATFEPYEEPPPPSAAPTANTDDNQSSQIPIQILQVAWFLTALINTNQDTNARLIQQLQEMPLGQRRDLHTDRVDHESLANLSAHLSILANMLSQQPAVSEELADHSHEDAPTGSCIVWPFLIPCEITGIRDQLASSEKAPLLRGVCV